MLKLFTQLSGLILFLVEVKTLCHPRSNNQQSLNAGPDYKKTNERGKELQRQARRDNDRNSKDRVVMEIYGTKV